MTTTSALSHYHDWLRDAHAMEKQAETMLEQMAKRTKTIRSCGLAMSSISKKPVSSSLCWNPFSTATVFPTPA